VSEHAHPAPRRHDINLTLLALALVATPSLWGLRLVINYALDSYFCYPGDARRFALAGGVAWVWPTLLAIDLLVLVFAASAAAISYRQWRASRDELASFGSAPMIEIGEGRTRFLALWGLLIGVGFAIAMVFDLFTLWIVPPCA
jgi:hypothetical protein